MKLKSTIMAQKNLSYEWVMYYGAENITKERARELRKRLTHEELLLWEHLRNKKMSGWKFRRQHPINIYIADFYCHELKLVIEIDGELHNNEDQKLWDLNRKAEFDRFGIRELRFTNEQITDNLSEVLTIIAQKSKAIKKHQALFGKA